MDEATRNEPRTIRDWAIKLFAVSLMDTLGEAPNCWQAEVTQRAEDGTLTPLVVTVQRQQGKMPLELLAEERDRRRTWEALARRHSDCLMHSQTGNDLLTRINAGLRDELHRKRREIAALKVELRKEAKHKHNRATAERKKRQRDRLKSDNAGLKRLAENLLSRVAHRDEEIRKLMANSHEREQEKSPATRDPAILGRYEKVALLALLRRGATERAKAVGLLSLRAGEETAGLPPTWAEMSRRMLKNCGLITSDRDRKSGGTWLTAEGRRVAESLAAQAVSEAKAAS